MTKLSGFFVTGTDTEVGKTLVSGALILKLRAQGKRVMGFKPVAAGTYKNAEGELLNEDLETLKIAAQMVPGNINFCPYVLDMPVAPHLAAANKGITLDLDTIMQALHKTQEHCDFVVIEGAGGFLIPLNEHENLGDFVEQIHLPIILVVGMKLGCINHALLTQEAIQGRELKLAGWVANSLLGEMSLLKENIDTLKLKINAPFLGHIPTLPKSLQKANNNPYSIEALDFAAQHLRIPNH